MFPSLNLRSYELYEVVLEMAAIWVCVYVIFRFLQGTRGAGVIKGFAVILVVLTLIIRVIGQGTDAFARLNFIYDRFLGVMTILLIVVFQPELRQAMIRLGHARLFRGGHGGTSRVVDAVSEAVTFLSKNQFGALIAIERSVRLGGLVEGGQVLDAEMSGRLLESIFWPNSPLHDLGVVVRRNRIVAAGVQFPLAEEGSLPSRFGSRHRAAVGLTVEADCVVVIVSEENGNISLAEHGQIEYDIPRAEFSRRLARRLAETPRDDRPADDSDRDAASPDGSEEMQAA
ncbi:MAG: diadenylate cyclase [Planctomycetota bacterium]|jgi:diadenylate cyclase